MHGSDCAENAAAEIAFFFAGIETLAVTAGDGADEQQEIRHQERIDDDQAHGPAQQPGEA